jgi:4-amino-4-deoxy-L-arabinose transferase-like glycosyltransferase
MQEGIGRGGYRVLAIVFFAVGALGLAIAALSGLDEGGFEWLGLGLAAVALAAVTGLVLATLGGMPVGGRAPRPSGPAGAPVDAMPLPTPEPPTEADPSADLGFEYDDLDAAQPLEPVSDVPPARPMATGPPPRPAARPTAASSPPAGRARKAGAGASDWPERSGPAGVTRRQLHERNLPRDPGPTIEVEGPARPTREPPVVMARTVASAEATGIPEGTGVGKCGNCGVLLLAPKKRPIRLQCPRCERVHTLA